MTNVWPEVRLSELVAQASHRYTVKPDQQYPNLGIYSFGRGLFAKSSISGMETRATVLYRVRQGQFIYSRLFAFEGAYGLVTPEFDGYFVSNEYPVFDCDRARLLPEYLAAYFTRPSVWQEVGRLSTGLGDRRRRVQPAQFLTYRIPLPSLAEQQRIVAKIDELAVKIAEARSIRQALIAETDAAFPSVTDSVFDSVECTWRAIDDLVGRDNLRNGKSVKPVDLPTGIQCIRLSALANGRINCRDAKPVAIPQEEATPYLIKPGDVFIMRGNGSKHLVGRAGLVETTVSGTIFPDLFIRVPLEGTGISSRFFVRFWNSGRMRTIIENACKTTSGIWKINQGHIASFSVPVPSPSEQCRITAYLDDLQVKVDSLKALQVQSEAELDALLPSVLDKAFKGDL